MSDIYSGEKGPCAVAAVKRLLPQHANVQIVAKPLGGCNAQAFRVDAITEAYFVRVLPEDGEWDEDNMKTVPTCVANTCVLGAAGITAEVVAADEKAVIQTFLPGGERLEYQDWSKLFENEQHDMADRIGQMIAAIHAVPNPDPEAALAPHCHYHRDIKGDGYAMEQPLLECWDYIESRPAPQGVGGEIVLTHGDLHNKNVLVKADGSLLAVDLELSGQGHRAFDIAFFFFHWEWFHPTNGYPSLSARQAIARSYLKAANYPATDADVRDLLWDVEYVVLRIAVLRANHEDIGETRRNSYMTQLPVACELLRSARLGDLSLRSAVVDRGVLPLSLSLVRSARQVGDLPACGAVVDNGPSSSSFSEHSKVEMVVA